jgi:hypothetical protein
VRGLDSRDFAGHSGNRLVVAQRTKPARRRRVARQRCQQSIRVRTLGGTACPC